MKTKEKREKLTGKASVKGTMLKAHLSWVKNLIGEDLDCLRSHVDEQSFSFINRPVLSMAWVPLRCLIQIDRAIAVVAGRDPQQVFHDLGRYSAALNLTGVYKYFVTDEPHRFFEQVTLHSAFQDFGKPKYERLSERSGKISMADYPEYSPVFCSSAVGFYEEALRTMKAPGPIVVRETSCQCDGDPLCCYEISW